MTLMLLYRAFLLECGSGRIFLSNPARVRESSARARPEPDSHSNILSEPDSSPTEPMSQLFILMTHLCTFFMNSLPQASTDKCTRSHKQALLNTQARTRGPTSICKLYDSHCKNRLK